MNQEQPMTTQSRAETMVAQGKHDVSGEGTSQAGATGTMGGVAERSRTRLRRSIRFVVKGLPAVCFCQLL